MISGSKYVEKGGPGASAIMALFSHSSNAYKDRLASFQSQVVFWLLAAIDGHAKNFSLALNSDGFRLTPFYDVISAYPYFSQGNIQRQKIKIAKKVHSKNTQSLWHDVTARNWLAHGNDLGLNQDDTLSLLSFLSDNIETALAKTFEEANAHFNVAWERR